ncbi:PREDICTED: atrial natriuretic peptide receptor 2-like isoform X2 [Branchiostoma belcheri]|uniref:Guanylate cyclase n=1 Tax=Branchiostoma belcheri TaxID=7741 RepID=A0A6P4YP92_BRABE|nr:PREDICTED: atrial natriuretic peptide receptor 2-like isoform X2 [Branchiostoma belcheri]
MDFGRHLVLGLLYSVVMHAGRVSTAEFNVVIVQPRNAEYEWTDTSLAHVTMDQIEPAVNLAIKSVGETGMLGQHNFTTHTVDSECSHYMTLVRLVDLYYKANVRPDVLIGPTCTYAVGHAGRLASHWAVPIISAGGQPSALRNKTGGYHGEYKTLTRMGVTYNKMANVVVELLWKYNWNRVALVHYDARNQQNDCKYGAQAIKEKLDRIRSNTTLDEKVPADKDPIDLVLDKAYDKDSNLSYDTFLVELAERARVVITCTPISDLQEMMRAARRLGMTEGEFAFIAIDPEFEGMYSGTHLWKTGPVGLWPLNSKSTSEDVSKSCTWHENGDGTTKREWEPNNNHGDLSSSVTLAPDRGSYYFGGYPGSKMVIPSVDGLDVRQSLTVLVKIQPSNGINGTIFGYNGSGMELLQLGSTGLSARFVRADGTILKSVNKEGVLEPEKWNYVGATYDYRTGIAKLWHDGKEVASESIGIVDLRTQGPITVGANFKGKITCLQIYNYSMDDSQIATAKEACQDGKDASSDEKDLIEAFRSVIAITLRKPATLEFGEFVKKLEERGVKENHYVTAYHDSMVLFATALNETIAAGVDPADLKQNGSPILQRMWNRTFQGAGKDNISIDELGDRDTDYTIVEMDKVSGEFKPFWDYMGFTKSLIKIAGQDKVMDWPGNKVPNPEPCGLRGSNGVAATEACEDKPLENILLYSLIAVLLLLVGSFLTYVWWNRRNDQELDRARRMLIIPKDNIIFCGGRMRPGPSMVLLDERSRDLPRRDSNLSLMDGQIQSQQFADTGYCKVADEATGNTQWQRVRIKKTCYTGVVQISDREIVLELKEMRDLSNSHDHLVRFVGVCREHFDNPTMILTEYCPKGSLMDVLQDERVKLDWVFQCNLMNDIIKGMRHIHSSKMRSHGNLTSSNCLVDARFAVKIGDFGLPSFRVSLGEGIDSSEPCEGEMTHAFYEKKLWCAPELLRQENPPKEGTQKGDIYSFGIIMQEIMLREGPFFVKEDDSMMAKSKVEHVMLKKSDSRGRLFRPTLPTLDDMEDIELEDDIQPAVNSNANATIPDLSQNSSNSPAKDKGPHSHSKGSDTVPLVPRDKMKDRRKEMMSRFLEEVQRLMSECWQEDPIQRPDFNHLFSHVRKFLGRDKTLVDNLLGRMQKIVSNLETIVDKRTEELRKEKEKSDMLLYRMLPSSIADQLKSAQKVQAERFECVTIYFSDIVGFTALVHKMKPMEVVTLLDDLYKMFDQIIDDFDVYKVETIGDAYMLVSGLPRKNGSEHVKEISRSALGILRGVAGFKIRGRPEEVLKIRIGIHSGECAAGVVGETMPRYCLFGDTVNIASRMESTGEAMKIHVSEDSYNLLQPGDFKLEYRDLTTVKGRPHPMKTYWLIEEKVVPVPNGTVFGTENSRSLPQLQSDQVVENPPSRVTNSPSRVTHPPFYSVETVC